MSDLTPDVVEHLATLARIQIDEGDRERIANDLVQIQHLISRVQEVATPEVPATSHPTVIPNVTRPDEVGQTLDRAEVLASAPDADETRFKVSAILGEEQ